MRCVPLSTMPKSIPVTNDPGVLGEVALYTKWNVLQVYAEAKISYLSWLLSSGLLESPRMSSVLLAIVAAPYCNEVRHIIWTRNQQLKNCLGSWGMRKSYRFSNEVIGAIGKQLEIIRDALFSKTFIQYHEEWEPDSLYSFNIRFWQAFLSVALSFPVMIPVWCGTRDTEGA